MLPTEISLLHIYHMDSEHHPLSPAAGNIVLKNFRPLSRHLYIVLVRNHVNKGDISCYLLCIVFLSPPQVILFWLCVPGYAVVFSCCLTYVEAVIYGNLRSSFQCNGSQVQDTDETSPPHQSVICLFLDFLFVSDTLSSNSTQFLSLYFWLGLQ